MTTTKVEATLGKERTLFTCSTPSVDLVVDSETIAWIVLNNKEKPVNVIGLQFITDMRKVLEIVNQLIDEKKVRVIVFYSEKSTFLAGADIHGMYPVVNEKIGADIARSGQRLFDQVNAIKVPTIAAINGSALGGGLELCLACTYRVAAKDSKAMIGLPEVKLGLIPGAGGTVRLPKIAGLQESLKIILAGAAVDPFKAKNMGIVDFLVDHEDRHPNENRFFNNVRLIAGKMVDQPSNRRAFKSKTFSDMLLNDNWIGRSFVANTALKGLDKSTKGKYPAPYKALESVMNSYKAPISRALDFEAQSFGKVAVSPESKNLMSIFFLQEQAKKMEAKVTAKPVDVKKIGVVGAGVMGSGIAQLFAHKDFPVYMKDIKEDFVTKGLDAVANLFGGLAKRGKLSAAEADRRRKLVTGGTSNNGFADAQVVVEAAIERMDLKKKILQEIEAIAPEVIFATNTSTLSITELASVAKNPENVVGFHFFNPVHKMPLVEIIRGKQTSEKTVATIYKLSLKLGKVPVVVNDGPGFLVNRVLGIYMLEAARLLKEGGDIQQIDQVIVNFGMPMGPFRLIDEVGLDVAAHSASTLESLGSRYSQKDANEMQKLVGQGYLGKKSGKGFYRYKDGKSQGLEPTLSEVIQGYNPNSRRKLPPEDIVDRCILLMVNEAAYILDEKIADTPEDVDLAMVMGTGFAPFRGGLLSFADNRGAKNIVKRLNSFQQKLGDRFKPAPLLLKMAQENTKFFPTRPNVPYHERSAPPRAKL